MSSGRIVAGDWLKALAAQVIVLHHLAFYGPMADHAWPLAPMLWSWLADEGRFVVQVFLVVGGLLAARAVAPEGRLRPGFALAPAVVQRYLRLALPVLGALVLAVIAAAFARAGMAHEATPDAPTAGQLLAHLFLVHDLAGVEGLSAGLWYVAIDFQSHLLLLALLGACALLRVPGAAPWLVAAGVAASLFVFNRRDAWDVLAPYHFAAFGLGVLVAWWGRDARRAAGIALLFALALALEFRPRIALAGLVGGGLWLLALRGRLEQGTLPRVVAWLSARSYALFLVHYPVCLVVNTVFERWVSHAPVPQAIGVLLAWALSLLAADGFQRVLERPVQRWTQGLALRAAA